MPLFDPLGTALPLAHPPKRIVSLVPSQTELLHALGLDNEVAGITKFCIHPDNWFRSKPRVGGTKTVHIERVLALRPDLVIANKEENVQAQVEELAREVPTWASDISNLAEALEAIRSIGALTHRVAKAEAIAHEIEAGFMGLQPIKQDRPRCGYLIWKEPYMSVGCDTFIHDMLQQLGVVNAFADRSRYPEVTLEDLRACELVLLSSEPYPFAQKHIDELQQQLPDARILLVDGELFSWYGSRLLQSPAYFRQLRSEISFNAD
ncbi:MAG: cobalamin-binding protein [Chitinophagaceae bacterium]|nr:MAG: cobalamin-binding protein [Chitinophagaceae bacterium]